MRQMYGRSTAPGVGTGGPTGSGAPAGAAADGALVRATVVLAAGERLVASAEVGPGTGLERPRWWRRPKVLRGQRMPGDRWEGVKDGMWTVLHAPGWPLRRMSDFFDRLFDGLFGRIFGSGSSSGESGPEPLGGGQGSLAHVLAVALYPRGTTTDVVPVLQLTDRRLLLTYVQRSRRGSPHGMAEAGPSVPTAQIAWVRLHHTSETSGVYDLGFADASWVRMRFEEPVPALVSALPSAHPVPVPAPAVASPPPHAHAPAHASAPAGGAAPRPGTTASAAAGPQGPSPSEPVEWWSGYTGREREVVERAALVLPADERLVASHHLGPGYRLRRPRRGRRPLAFDGLRMPGDRWRGFWRALGRCLSVGLLLWGLLGYPFSLLLEYLSERHPRGRGRALGGGWDSQAGRFAAALFPRAPTTGVTHVVQLSDRHLRVAYVQCARAHPSMLGAVDSGFVVDRTEVVWLRPRPDISRQSCEFGFRDGSWARVSLAAPSRRDFLDRFPEGPPR
ncbi:hypothetical protein JGS22_017455 [Streptomyces sp. P38-E01]|uniref:Uncharacterized protein n=1 Tax=Streptomyces tardus TaxID=2780544 RepID=A0A949JI84_9ACTN|nr:hypothetical protein [Streptomyces tardus]MBU7599353.1 hypothetical protein [Streptomyces tardus]